ncbi:hypothetical protein NM208_g4794 [Fusarium decemcellulare]|uniref:Uncharacterized protein n=1 Tax=Fusarium decemcellulare TaxID=57161 RepID=A0ACC1SJI2_9HYPO|nr:hypothetical protein NM208_g4794 [Fusarium decemcellulare]
MLLKSSHGATALAVLSLSRCAFVTGAAVQADTSLRQCLADAVQGDNDKVQFSDEEGFLLSDVRPYNLNLQYSPLAITYPDSANEVAEIVACAASKGRKVQARSGGRDFINKCIGGQDGHVIVDLHKFSKVEVDPQTNVASVGPGNLLGDMVRGLHRNGGRFIPHGSSRSVGVGGHFMVGGLGYTSRQHGLSIDTLQEVEVVLANGTIVSATQDEHQDLFWAMRGAGASFGIATEFKVKTKAEPAEVVEFTYVWESEDPAILGNALKAYYEMIQDQNLSLKLGGTLRLSKTSLVFSGGFFGSEAEFDQVGLSSRLPPVSNTTVIPNLSWINFMEDILASGGATNNPAYFAIEDTVITRSLLPTNQTLDAFLDYIYTTFTDSAQWSFLFDIYGGAVSQVRPHATAFPHRDALVCVTAYVSTADATDTQTEEILEQAVLKLQGGDSDSFGSYAGVSSLSLGEKAQVKYWGDNLGRLENVKAVYDPKDVFSTPQGVKLARG